MVSNDEREALARIVKDVTIKWSGPSMAEFADTPPIRKHYAIAEAILDAGFRRQGPVDDDDRDAMRAALEAARGVIA